MSDGLYDAFRVNGGPTIYGPLKTPWEADLVTSGLIFCFVILAFSFFIILPGIQGNEKLFAFIRITVSLIIGAVILVVNFSDTWEVAETTTHTKYKAGTGKEINAKIGVNIGLRGINITLKGDPEEQLNETINYNEHFSWEWPQGRMGFGPFAGRFNREYRAAQFRGLPLPILWIAEYFTFDGEGIRWGRHYRQAGWFAHILLWFSFPLWLLSNAFFFMLLRYGAWLLMMTGCCMVTSSIIWATIRNLNDLVIPFTAENRLVFAFGISFWANLITGVICIILGIIIWIMDLRKPAVIANFFNVDVLQDSSETSFEDQPTAEGDDIPMEVLSNGNTDDHVTLQGDIPPTDLPGDTASEDDIEDDEDIYEPPTFMAPAPPKAKPKRGLTQRFQKNRRRPPPPPPPDADDTYEIYENQGFHTNSEEVRVQMQ